MQPIYDPDILLFHDIFTDSESKHQGCLEFQEKNVLRNKYSPNFYLKYNSQSFNGAL